MAETKNTRVTFDRCIKLTKMDPVERLKELCKQGKYRYNITWDKYENGFMCECEIHYFLSRKRSKTLKKEVCWVETRDLRIAQRTVVATLLDNIGLGVEKIGLGVEKIEEEPQSKNEFDEVRIGMKVVTEDNDKINIDNFFSPLENKSWADY